MPLAKARKFVWSVFQDHSSQFALESRLYGLLLQFRLRSASSPPTIIGTPPDTIISARPLRAALRWSAAMPPWSQLLLLSSPPSLGPSGQAWLLFFELQL